MIVVMRWNYVTMLSLAEVISVDGKWDKCEYEAIMEYKCQKQDGTKS
jgi:hypothetical protein